MARRASAVGPPTAVADAFSLPFPDRTFDLVHCMRLLHHFPEPASRILLLSELARVTRRQVLFSFYRRGTLQGIRRSLRTSARVALPLSVLRDEARSAGLTLRGVVSLLPFVREQTLVLAERTAADA